MTDNTLLTPEQFARDLAETISRQFQTRVSIQLNRHQPEHNYEIGRASCRERV